MADRQQIARLEMQKRELQFVKYLNDGKKLFDCEITAKVEIVGTAVTSSVVIQANPCKLEEAPVPQKKPAAPRKRSPKK